MNMRLATQLDQKVLEQQQTPLFTEYEYGKSNCVIVLAIATLPMDTGLRGKLNLFFPIVPDQKVYIVKAARTDLSIIYPDRYAVRLGTVQLSWAIASIIIEVIGLLGR